MRSTATPAAISIGDLPVQRLREAPALLAAQWEETATEKVFMDLDPDWRTYEAMERTGRLLTLGVFDGSDLVGYSLGIVMPHPNCVSKVHYSNAQFYVLPSHRRSGIGRFLYNTTRQRAMTAGAEFILWRVKPGSPMDRVLREWATVAEQEIVLSEVL